MNKKIEKICIVNVGLLGDVLMRTPVIREIKRLFPNSKITCIVDPIGQQILSLNQDVDEIYILNRKKDNKLQYLMNKVKAQYFVCNTGFDMIIDLYGGKSTNKLMQLNFIKYKIGLIDGKPWSNKLPYQNIEQKKFNKVHLTHHFFKVLNFLCNSFNNSTKPTLTITENKINDMKKYLFTLASRKNIDNSKMFLISLGSGGVEKILDLHEQFKIILYMYEKYGYTPVIVSNPGQEYLQKDLIQKYISSSNIPYIKLETLGLEDISGIMKNVKFIMLPDTGLYHMAVALDVPIFCLFTYTNPILVLPDQGIMVECFHETNNTDKNGIKVGDNHFSIEYLQKQVDTLIQQI